MQPSRVIVNSRALLAILLVAFGIARVAGSELNDAAVNEDFDDVLNNTVDGKTGRIVGGIYVTSMEQFPFQLSLRYKGVHVCGASVLNSKYALTAAHCVLGRSIKDFSIYAGSTLRLKGGTLHKAIQIKYHADYKSQVQYDLALVKVSVPFKYSAKIKPVKLPIKELTSGSKVTISGWGALFNAHATWIPTFLTYANLYTQDRLSCGKQYNKIITNSMMCARNSPIFGACVGDSGGPLMLNGIQYGVISYGHVDEFGRCQPKFPTVSTNLADAKVRSWIYSNAK